jgi:serine/threonine-protein kinase RsbW
MKPLHLEFVSDTYSLYHLEHFFCYLVDGLPLSTEKRHTLRLCFQEAVTNAINHGNQYSSSKKVEIYRWIENNQIFFQIKDEGDGFCLESAKKYCIEENKEKTSGRGIFLIHTLATSLSYIQADSSLVFSLEL